MDSEDTRSEHFEMLTSLRLHDISRIDLQGLLIVVDHEKETRKTALASELLEALDTTSKAPNATTRRAYNTVR